MPRQVAELKDFSFIGGLNTEAGFLTFPPNSWLDGDNVIPEVDGSISRRVKLDYEDGFEFSSAFNQATKETFAFTVHRWEAVAGNGSQNFLVVQQGNIIRFYNTAEASVSPEEKPFTVDLTTYRVSSSPNVFGTQPVSVAYGNGKLVMVSQDTDPILITYAAATDSISVTRLTLKIRDFVGVVDETTSVTQNPATLTALHNYNLQNQGWDTTKINAYFASQASYPDNTQIWVYGKNATDDFDPATLVKQDFGTSAAPKGRFILDIFTRDRTTVSGITNVPTETETGRPQTTAFFAGRAWYAGARSATIGSWVLFSRVVDADEKYQQCHQEADPTAEVISDLIASDGGVIPIPESGSILRLVSLQESLIVFAENGIWQILGDTTGGFRADGYQVKKLTSFGCSSRDAIIEVENTVAFWSPSGIFLLNKDVNTGDFVPQSLSLNKIQSLYTAIPGQSKRYASGFYDTENKQIIWMFQSMPNPDNTTDRFKKDRFLIFDIRLQAFYTFTIADLASESPSLMGGILSINPGISSVDFNVTESDSDQIITSGGDSVIISTDSVSDAERIAKYLVVHQDGTDYSITFGDFEGNTGGASKWFDWFSADGVGMESPTLPFIVTGYKIAGGNKSYQAVYITTFMKRTETGIDSNGDGINGSSAILQARWDWTDADATRWSYPEEVYRRRHVFTPASIPSATYEDGYPVVVAKSKIRGNGKALNLKYTASTGKDMQIIGWAIPVAINASV